MNIKLILKWVAGIFLLLLGLSYLGQGGIFSALFFFIGGLTCLPPTFKRIDAKFNFSKTWHKYATVIVATLLGLITAPNPSSTSSGGSPFGGGRKEKKNCSDAVRYADDAYTNANRAYNSSELDDAQDYARRAKSSADDAKRAANNCDCDDAERYASDAYDLANRAYNSSDLDDAKDYARRAKNEAESAKREADDCNDEYKD